MTNESRKKVEMTIRRCLGSHKQEQSVIIGLFLAGKGLKEVADELGVEPLRVVALKEKGLDRLRRCRAFFDLLE